MNRLLLVTTSLFAAGLLVFGSTDAYSVTPSVEVNFRALDELQRGYAPAPAGVYIPQPQISAQIPVQQQVQIPVPQAAPQMVEEMPVRADQSVQIPVQIPYDNFQAQIPAQAQVQQQVQIAQPAPPAPQYDTVQIPVQIPADGGMQSSQPLPPPPVVADIPLPPARLPAVSGGERYAPSGQLRWIKGPDGKQRLDTGAETSPIAKLPPADLPSEEGLDLASMKRKPKLQSDEAVAAAEPKVKRVPVKNKSTESKSEKEAVKLDAAPKLPEVKVPEVKVSAGEAPVEKAVKIEKPAPEKKTPEVKAEKIEKSEKIEKAEVAKPAKVVEMPPLPAAPKLPEVKALEASAAKLPELPAAVDDVAKLPELPVPQPSSAPEKEVVKSVIGKNDGKQVTGESSFKDKLMARIKGDSEADKTDNKKKEEAKSVMDSSHSALAEPKLPDVPAIDAAHVAKDKAVHVDKPVLPPLPALPSLPKGAANEVKAPELPKLSDVKPELPNLPELPKGAAEQKIESPALPAIPKDESAKSKGTDAEAANVLSKLPSLNLPKADKISDEAKLAGAENKLAELASVAKSGDKSGDKIFSIKFLETETDLPLSSTDNLKGVIIKMNNSPNARFNVTAYASGNKEQATAARRISLSRALAVKKFLESNGVKKEAINVQAMGNKSEPGSDGDRVDVYIDKN